MENDIEKGIELLLSSIPAFDILLRAPYEEQFLEKQLNAYFKGGSNHLSLHRRAQKHGMALVIFSLHI